MSKSLTITLTDEEFALLERKAAQERRTPREMAAYLVTRPALILTAPQCPQTYPLQRWQNPVTVTTDYTSAAQQPCVLCGQLGSHICGGRTYGSSVQASITN